MRNPLSTPSRVLFVLGLAVFTLSACGQPLESPETVLKKAKQAIVDIHSGQFEVTAKAVGNNGVDDLDFKGGLQLAFDKSDEANQKADLHINLSGKLQAEEKTLDGDFDFNFVTVANEYFVKLNKLSSSDDSLTNIQPLLDMYMGKWLRIDETFIPENIRNLQTEDEAVKLKQKQMEELFVETTLFSVDKEYGVEKLNGRSVYHYGLAPNLDGFKEYMTKAAIIDGRELTTQEVEEAVQVLSYIKQIEIYVDVEEYYILKSVFQFSGEALTQGANLQVQIEMEGADFNKSVSVSAPEDAEDFNPLNLVMGLGGVPTVPVDSEGVTLDEPPAPGTTLEMEAVSEGVAEEGDLMDDSTPVE